MLSILDTPHRVLTGAIALRIQTRKCGNRDQKRKRPMAKTQTIASQIFSDLSVGLLALTLIIVLI